MIYNCITIRGKVQGVGYRYFTLNTAKEHGITGYVFNQPDGSVQANACGNEHDMKTFIACLRIGPISSNVEEIEIRPIDEVKFNTFEIIR